MSESVQISCPACLRRNRVPAGRLADAPKCGNCHQKLFTSRPIVLTRSSFRRFVDGSDIPIVVDFWAPWCGPCRMVAPVVEELSDDYDGKVKFVKLNTDENPVVAGKYGIRSIPTLLIFKGGEAVGQVVGFRPKSDLAKHLDEVVDTARQYSDEVAERAVAIGVNPDGNAGTVAAQSPLATLAPGWVSTQDAVAAVAAALDTLSARLRERVVAVEEADPITQDLLIEVTDAIEQHRWMFSAQLS